MNALIQREKVGSGSILLVDDDVTLTRAIGRHLQPFRPTIQIHSGQAALDLLENAPRLCGAVVDVNLGEGPDGLTVVKELRARHRHVPVLILAGELTDATVCCAYDQRTLLLKKGTADLRLNTFAIACLVADLEPEEALAEVVADEAALHGFSRSEVEAILDALHDRTGSYYRDVRGEPLATYRARTQKIALKTGLPFGAYVKGVFMKAVRRDRHTPV